MTFRLLLIIGIGIIIGIVLILEAFLRLILGLGNPLLYLPDEKIGYLLAPHQQVRRFGKLIKINQYSMRSDEVEENIPHNSLRIILLGDSIANGGWWTDQRETISSLLANDLQSHMENVFTGVEVLNASANSWGPRNQLAYLQKFGTFKAKVLILLLNTDDLFATVPTTSGVGVDPNYPKEKPILAIQELWQKFGSGRVRIPMPKEQGDRTTANLQAIAEIQQIAENNQLKFLLAMTPLKRELTDGSKPHEIKARERLLEFTQTKSIAYIDFLPSLQNQDVNSIYQDGIHVTPLGNQIISDILTKFLSEELSR